MNLFNFNPSKSVQAGPSQTIDAHTLRQWLDQKAVTLIDVRESDEYAAGHISGATLVPLSGFDSRKIPQSSDQKLVLYCRAGQRSTMAAQKLWNDGVSEVIQLEGGITAWMKAGYPVQV